MRPQSYFSGNMRKAKVTSLAFPGLSIVGISNYDLEKGVVVPAVIILGKRGELLVGRH